MPLYTYACPACGWTRTDVRTIPERHDGPRCERCLRLEPMKLVIDPVRGIVKDPAAGPRGSR